MIIPVLTCTGFLIKAGTGCYIYFTSENRIDSGFSGCTIKIDHPVHNTVIRDRTAVHAQLFDSFDTFLYLIRAVKQRIFRMHMQMSKCHVCFLRKTSDFFDTTCCGFCTFRCPDRYLIRYAVLLDYWLPQPPLPGISGNCPSIS